MAEFAFSSLVAVPLLKELAQHGLGVYAKRHFLHLYRLEQFGSLSLRRF